jgi:hypothetical protein
MNELRNDTNLREAVSRREQQQAPMPTDLNERLMQRLGETEQTRPEAKPRRLWLYTASALAIAASIALLIIFNFGKQPTPQEPLVAQQTYQGDGSSDTSSANEEPVSADAPIIDVPVYQKNRPHATKKQRKVVMKLVELIPTSEENPALTAAAEPAPEMETPSSAYDAAEEDPLVAMAAQLEDIRQRGQRLQQEIDKRMDN